MSNMQLHYTTLSTDETGLATITGFDPSQIVSEIGATELLDHMEYSDIVEWMAQKEQERVEEANE